MLCKRQNIEIGLIAKIMKIMKWARYEARGEDVTPSTIILTAAIRVFD